MASECWLPFERRELIARKRCPDCGCHVATQGHKDECRTRVVATDGEATSWPAASAATRATCTPSRVVTPRM